MPSADKPRRSPNGRAFGAPIAKVARRSLALAGGCLLIAAVSLVPSVQAAPGDPPLFTFSPKPEPPPPIGPPPPMIPPPNSYLNGPCGLAVDSGGRFYIADHYHDTVDVYDGAANYLSPAPVYGDRGYITQLSAPDDDAGPCYLALESGGDLYVGDYHGAVRKYSPAAYPPTAGAAPPDTGTRYALSATIDSGQATGLAVDSAGEVYVAHRDRVSVYDSAGSHQADIGLGSLGEGYGVAVSATGVVYVADASTNTVKAYDPADGANFPADPSSTIPGPYNLPDDPVAFTSLRDAALALEEASGELYVIEDTQPTGAEQPRGRVHAFSAAGAYLGHLKRDVVNGAPSGIAVDNSSLHTGRVYVTSGNTHFGGIYAYGADSASAAAPLAPSIPPPAPGGGQLFPVVPVGSAAPPPGGIACEGDNCQVLPPPPVDPTLTTLLEGVGNTKPRYRRYPRNCRQIEDRARRKRCRRANRAASASASTAALPSGALAPAGGGAAGPGAASASAPGPTTQGLLPGAAGFDAAVWSEGEAATVAGSHPYSLQFTLGLDQGGGPSELRDLLIELPPGLLLNPAFSAQLCSAADFATSRSSPYAPSLSGESCPERSQVGTVEVSGGAGATRRFGLFELDDPPVGSAFRLAAAPFGQPLVFDAEIESDQKGTYLLLAATDVPGALQLQGLELTLWGAPWDASHNTERGNCLNEAAPGFAWCKSSVGEPTDSPPRAFLTLPTECRDSLPFFARVSSWQEAGEQSASALNRDSGGDPAPIEDCSSLVFNPAPEGFLSVKKASSSSGFTFRFSDTDPGLADPRGRVHAQAREAVVELPDGVTLNPSLGAGLQTCSPAQLANESAFNPQGAGCPNGSKIGAFSVRLPFYDGLLNGGVYLATPDEPGGAAGVENPFDSLLAVYLIAKSADRGVLITVPGKLIPDPGDGTLTATFDDLPQLPYTDLEVNFRSGQRAPLISPPSCGWATTKVTMTPWAAGAPRKSANSLSPITSGIDFGPCPTGATPPFSPGAIAGGVNANVGSYTPYYIHLSRKDTEQEITSYSLVLPKGITGKIAGIPFCPDAAIEAARHKRGFDEIANPSCPQASQVGRTDTGYGVGPALTYAPGRIYLAGPYGGSPLSLVTINAATVGPFDLGTIVIRSAFDVEERTAQLQIDSSASDPIPHIIDGVPLHLRDVRVYMDRFQFTHNPSSCEASSLISTLTGSGATFSNPADDSTATVGKHFQLLNCLTLGFRPRLGLRLRGSARRGGYPSLRANFVSRGAKDSNLKRIEVEMPHSLFLAQNHIRTVCTREQFSAEKCPTGSIYGKAMAQTLLFDTPLRGNVYLRSSSNKLPDLVADLRSGAIRIVVEGRIGPGKHGGILTFFDNLPDAPIDRFTMTLSGGRHGLLQNSSNICANPPLATISALGQNNIGARFSSELRGQCKKKGKKGKRRENRR
ncbi:MAG TPA: NHL repeat-containing protein [Solirubrobacterales bacterium]|nr:NHL repeat-containing protein [Solirubrobacterales bacterium]